MYSCCCEYYGYRIVPTLDNFEFEGDNVNIDDPDWIFDVFYDPQDINVDCDLGGALSFLLHNERTAEQAFLVLYNCHNGYYGHGWNTSFGCEGYL